MNRIILILLFFVIVRSTNAQLLIGPVIGGCISKVYYFDSQPRYQSVPSFGFDGGVMVSMRVKRNFTLNGQLLYAYRTKTIEGTNRPRTDPLFHLTSQMNYIELPIYYALEFKRLTGDLTGQGGQVKTYNWFIGAGPVISYWLSEKGSLSSSNPREINIDHIDYTTRFGTPDNLLNFSTDTNIKNVADPNRYQFGVNFTGGVAFEPVGFHKIVASFQLTLQQTFFSDKSNGIFTVVLDDVDILKSRNHNIRFSLAYLFDTKLEKRKKGKSTKKIAKRRR